MRRATGWLVIMMLGLVLSGCVSNRAVISEPEITPTSAAMALPTLPPLEGLPQTPTPSPVPTAPPTPTPDAVRSAPSDVDSALAIPRDYLEGLGLVAADIGVDIFSNLAQQHYEGTVLFDNYWELPEGSSGSIVELMDFRYTFPSSSMAELFLRNTSIGLNQAAENDGNQVKEIFVYLSDTAYMALFTEPGQRVYAAHFASGQTAGIVIIAGDNTLTKEQVLSIFSLAAQPLKPNQPSLSTQTADTGELETVAGMWGAQHLLIHINTDGTGEINLNRGCCSGVTYYLSIGTRASPVTGTIVGRSFIGDIDPTEAARPGDTITFHIEIDENPNTLIVTMPDSERQFSQQLEACRNGGNLPCAR